MAVMKNFLASLEFSLVLVTQTNSKSGEDVSQIIRAWIVEKYAVKTDIQLEKKHKLICVRKDPICVLEVSSIFYVYLSFTNKLIIK